MNQIISILKAVLGSMSVIAVLISLLISFGAFVLLLVAQWKLFEKAGEPGWKSLIPCYRIYILFKIAWGPVGFAYGMALFALLLILSQLPSSFFLLLLLIILWLAILALTIVLVYKLAKAFGHGIGYTLGLILLPGIFIPILGFGSDYYLGPQ